MRKMTLKDARQFVKKFHGKSIPIHFSYCGGHTAEALLHKNSIEIDEFCWCCCRYYPLQIQAVLAHEIGHFNIDNSDVNYKQEMHAHLWAISRSRHLGMKNLCTILKDEFVHWSRIGGTDGKIYRMARRKYLERKRSNHAQKKVS